MISGIPLQQSVPWDHRKGGLLPLSWVTGPALTAGSSGSSGHQQRDFTEVIRQTKEKLITLQAKIVQAKGSHWVNITELHVPIPGSDSDRCHTLSFETFSNKSAWCCFGCDPKFGNYVGASPSSSILHHAFVYVQLHNETAMQYRAIERVCEGSCTPLGDHYSAGNCRETWDWPAHWDSNSDSQSHQAPQLQSGFVLVHVGTSAWVSTRQSSHKVLVWNGLNINMLSPDSRWPKGFTRWYASFSIPWNTHVADFFQHIVYFACGRLDFLGTEDNQRGWKCTGSNGWACVTKQGVCIIVHYVPKLCMFF